MGGGGSGEVLTAELRAEIGDFVGKMDEAKTKFAGSTKSMQDDAQKASGGIVEKMGGIGPAITKTVLPAAIAVGGAATVLAGQWSGANTAMQAATGATGKKLEDLMGSVQNVTGTVKGNMGQVADTMSTVAAKTDLVGKPLEDLTRKFLQLKESGIDVSVGQVGAAFARWGIPVDQWGTSMERVLKVSQATGRPMGDVLDQIAKGAPALQGLGFSFNDASLLAGKLSNEALPGLSKALGKMIKTDADVEKGHKAVTTASASREKATAAVTTATTKLSDAVAKHGAGSSEAAAASARLDAANAKLSASTDKLSESNAKLGSATKDPKDALNELIASIKDAPTAFEADAKAAEIFGKKAGPELALQIRSGKFELGAMTAEMDKNTSSIAKGAEAHRTFATTLGMLKDRVGAMVAPFAEQAQVVATIAVGVGPVISGLQKTIGFMKGLRDARAAATVASAAAAPVEVTEAAANVTAGASAATASGGFFALAAGVWAAIAPLLPIIAALAAVGAAAYLLYQHWDEVWGFVKSITRDVVGFVKGHLDIFIVAVMGPIAPLLLLWRHWDQVWGGIRDTVGAVKDFIVDTVEAIISAIGRMKSAISDIPGMGILGSGLGAIGIPGFHAVGGMVPGYMGQPQLAVVHGGEQITPAGHSGGGAGGGGGVNVYVTVQGSVWTSRDLAKELAPLVEDAHRERLSRGSTA